MELVELVLWKCLGGWLEECPDTMDLGEGRGVGPAGGWIPVREGCMALPGSYSQGLGRGRDCGGLLPAPRLCLLPLRTPPCGLERAGFQSTHDAH